MDDLVATDLTLSQIRSVFILGMHGSAMSVNELASEIGLSLAAAGRGVDKLVGMGIVDRREDATDRRIKRISLTEKGQAIVDAQTDVRDDIVKEFAGRLPDDVRDDLCSALDRIVNSDNDYWHDLAPQPKSTTQKADA